jgi:hypothetical protein
VAGAAVRSRTIAVLVTVAMAAFAAVPADAAPNHPSVVGTVPSALTPDVQDNNVAAIYDAGSKVIVGGNFTRVQNRDSDVDIPRRYLFSFDKATGLVDTTFVPVLDDDVTTLTAGPTPGTVYVAGRFNTVNGVTRRKVALLNVANGSVVTSFVPPAFNGLINDVALVGGRLLVGGVFTTAGAANARGGLASLNASTGALDTYLTVRLTGNHNWNGTGVKALVGVESMDVTADGTKLIVIGNFKQAGGVTHDQIVLIDLGPTSATIANWNTDRYNARCVWQVFDSWVRDVAFSPDGRYFVVVTTGGPNAGTLCDSAARWETNAVGSALQPTWVNYTGGDTLLSIAITEQAIYVGGHIRWLNNSLGADNQGAGAVARPSIAALDPLNGLPLSWNPGRHPRGYGVTELYLTGEGLWIGHDQQFMGNYQHRRERLAFLPLAGGAVPHSTASAALPGKVVALGAAGTAGGGGGQPLPPTVLYRVNAGGAALAATDGGPGWTKDDGSTNTYRNTGSSKTTNTVVTTADSTVPASTPLALFRSMRYDAAGGETMQWNFPATAGRTLEVRLYFADPCTCTANAGQRVFDVTIDGRTVLDNFDVVAATGPARGTMKSLRITSDGNVDLDFVNGVQSPIISGIEILQENVAAPTTTGNGIVQRAYDGVTKPGAATALPSPDSTIWSSARGAFWVGGTLFYGLNGSLQRRTFNGTSFGPVSAVDPYHDPVWDNVRTDGANGQTYAGIASNFYAEIPSVTGMFYSGGRLYYTLSGQTGMFWRWFAPDSGIVGADKFAVSGASGFSSVGAMFVSGSSLYLTNRSTGTLSRMGWTGAAPSGVATTVSGPAVDGVDWRAGAVFLAA